VLIILAQYSKYEERFDEYSVIKELFDKISARVYIRVDSLKGVRVTWPRKLLPAFMNPKIGHPLGAGQHGAGGVPRHVVALAVGVQVVPERRRALPGPEGNPQTGKHRGAPQLHVRGIHEEGGDAIACAEAGEGVLFLAAGKVKVWLVVAADPVVGHLQLLAGLHIQAGQLGCSAIDKYTF
jgi:hypothetical protein